MLQATEDKDKKKTRRQSRLVFYSNRLVYGNYSVIVDFEIFILTESGNVLGYVCTAVRTNGLHFAGSVFGGIKYGFPITVCVGKSVYDLGENLMVAILALEVLGKTGFGAGGSLRFSKDVLLVTECINGLLSYLVSLAVGAEFTVGETAFDTSGRLAGSTGTTVGATVTSKQTEQDLPSLEPAVVQVAATAGISTSVCPRAGTAF